MNQNCKTLMLRKLTFLVGILFSLTIMQACNIEGDLPPENEVNLFGTAEVIPELSIFAEAVELALLSEPLGSLGPFTIFAPNNDAFRVLFSEVGVNNIRQVPPDVLQSLLLYHIVNGRLLSKNITEGELQTFLPETSLTISGSGNNIRINEEVSIVRRDIEATNGMIHMVDAVIFPPSNNIMEALENNGKTIFVQLMIASGLAETLANDGPFTVFAPSNAAFERYLEDNLITGTDFLESPLLQSILSYHISEGILSSQSFTVGPLETINDMPFYFSEAINGNLWLNGIAGITGTNINADNGIIHVIDYVLTPPSENIRQFLANLSSNEDPEFRLLIEAIQLAGLEDELESGTDNNLTLFAPTDAAFENLLENLNLSSLSEIPVNTLREILLYHIVSTRVFSQDLRDDEPLETLIEDTFLIPDIGDQLINEARMLPEFLNSLTLNGVIHGIDTVLIPE